MHLLEIKNAIATPAYSSAFVKGPQYAIDGIIGNEIPSPERIYVSGHTHYPWLQVELVRESMVKRIIMYNRIRSWARRAKSLEFRAGLEGLPKDYDAKIIKNMVCGNYAGPGARGEEIIVDCIFPIKATYVTVQIMVEGYLNFEEIKVYGIEGNWHVAIA